MDRGVFPFVLYKWEEIVYNPSDQLKVELWVWSVLHTCMGPAWHGVSLQISYLRGPLLKLTIAVVVGTTTLVAPSSWSCAWVAFLLHTDHKGRGGVLPLFIYNHSLNGDSAEWATHCGQCAVRNWKIDAIAKYCGDCQLPPWSIRYEMRQDSAMHNSWFLHCPRTSTNRPKLGKMHKRGTA